MAEPPPTPKFPDVLERHRAALNWVARFAIPHRLRSRLDPEDLAQETFLDVMKNPCVVDRLAALSDREQLAYLRRALLNNAYDAQRQRAPEGIDARALGQSSVNLAERFEAGHTSPSMCAMRVEQIEYLGAALAALPDTQRAAVEMRYIRGLRVADIATQLNSNANAVSQLIFRALAALRGVLPDPNS